MVLVTLWFWKLQANDKTKEVKNEMHYTLMFSWCVFMGFSFVGGQDKR